MRRDSIAARCQITPLLRFTIATGVGVVSDYLRTPIKTDYNCVKVITIKNFEFRRAQIYLRRIYIRKK